MDQPHTIIGASAAWDASVVLSRDERLRHIGVLGSTGVGKSTFLLNLVAQDIARGDGVFLIDPHGSLAEDALDLVPPERHNQVCYLDLSNLDFPVGLNIVEDGGHDLRPRRADAVVSAMRAIWHDSWGARLEEILRHSLVVLIETPNASLALLPRLLTDDEFRSRLLAHVSDPFTRSFFAKRFEVWRDSYRDEVISPVLNKVEAFLFSPAIRNILGQSRSTLDLEHIMQRPRIVIANLAKGNVGDTAAHLMGALLIARVQTAALSRHAVPSARDWHMIIDEAQNFGTEALASLLSEARKFGLSLTVATQYTASLSEATRAALLGNVATLLAFRLGVEDAQLIAPHFDRTHQQFAPAALQELGRGHAYVRIAGQDTQSVELPPPPTSLGSAHIVKQQSIRHYTRRRADVERNMLKALGYRA